MGIREAFCGLGKDSPVDGWLVKADKIIREFEGCHKVLPDGLVQAYPDPATGAKPWTIGYGSTGPDVSKGIVWTQAQCNARLLSDLTERFGPAVDKLVDGVPIKPREKSALVSFAYNLGEGRLEESTLLRKFRDGNVAGAADEFLRWTYANGKHMRGLARRREAERALFLGIPRR
jgi:GH24 family phage-related lysozyme (muramidase)